MTACQSSSFLTTPFHTVWAGEAGSGVSMALMENLAKAITEGGLLAESAWVLLPNQSLVSPWKQQWQLVAHQHGIPSSFGVRVLTQFEWQLHWLNQYFMLATPLASLLAKKLAIAWMPSEESIPWQVLQSRWETVGQASLVWLLKTCPLLDEALTDNFTLSDWATVLEATMANTALPDKLASIVSVDLLQQVRTWLFEQTLAKGWLPKPWIALLYDCLLVQLASTNTAFSGIAQQVKLLVVDDVQQLPSAELHSLLMAVGFETTPVWLGVKLDPFSLEANAEAEGTAFYTQTTPAVLTTLQQWQWHYTLMDGWQRSSAKKRIIAPVQTALVSLLTEQPKSVEPPSTTSIVRLPFDAEIALTDWLKSAVKLAVEQGQTVGVLVPSNKLKAQWQAHLLSIYDPLEATWMRLLTLCLAGWHLAVQGKQLEPTLSFPWQQTSQNQPLLSSWLWVEHPEWADALQQWEVDVTEAIQPFCTQPEWHAFWQDVLLPTWQTESLVSHWLTAWVKALFPLLLKQQASFAWQRLYLPLLKELQSLEQRLGVETLASSSHQLPAWVESFLLPWTLPAKRSTANEQVGLPMVLTYQEAIGHRFDMVYCPHWRNLPDVRSAHEAGAFDAISLTSSVEQWLPKTVLNEVMGAWATAENGLWLLEYTPVSDALELGSVTEESAKAVFLTQQLVVPVLENTLGIYPVSPPVIPADMTDDASKRVHFASVLPLESSNLPLLTPSEKPLYLSVSGLEEYLKCPKRFYYSRVLRLPSDPSDALLKGNLIHLIMEHFNLQATPETHTPEHLLAIANQLLSVETHRHNPPIASILENDHYQAYVKLPRLLRFQLQQECLAGFENLRVQGYFSKPITHVQPELDLPDVELKGLPGVRFKMMLDAVLHHPDESLTLVDYKAYGASRYSSSKGKSLEHLHSVLEPLPTLEAGETGFAKAVMEHRHYQLALYAYGLQDVSLKDAHQRLAKVGLQLVRPQREQAKFETGSIGLFLDADTVLDARQTVLESLKVSVVDRLKTDADFLPNPAGGYCDTCSFSAICSATQATVSEEEG
jgi:hypothetical protein